MSFRPFLYLSISSHLCDPSQIYICRLSIGSQTLSNPLIIYQYQSQIIYCFRVFFFFSGLFYFSINNFGSRGARQVLLTKNSVEFNFQPNAIEIYTSKFTMTCVLKQFWRNSGYYKLSYICMEENGCSAHIHSPIDLKP